MKKDNDKHIEYTQQYLAKQEKKNEEALEKLRREYKRNIEKQQAFQECRSLFI